MSRRSALPVLACWLSAAAASGEPPRTPARPVRPEAWVEESRYHDGAAPERVTITARVDVLSRPAAGTPVVGTARRGETLSVVRASRDERWFLIELGGGEVGWIPVASTRALAGPAPRSPTAPPPPSDLAPSTANDPAPPAAPAPAANPAPPPRPKRGRGRRSEASADPAPPPVTEPAAVDAALTTAPPRAHQFGLSARAGMASLGQRFTSDSSGFLMNYEAAAWGAAVEAELGYRYLVRERVYLGLDAAYRFGGATGYRIQVEGAPIVLALQLHDLDAGVAAGVRFNVLGGLTVSLRLGGRLIATLLDQNPKAPLPSARLLALATSLRIDAAAIVGGLGLRLEGGLLAPGSLVQTGGLGEGSLDGLLGGAAAIALRYLIGHGVGIEAGWRYSFTEARLRGPAERNPLLQQATRTEVASSFSLGITAVY